MDGYALTYTADRLDRERAAALDRENEILSSIADRGVVITPESPTAPSPTTTTFDPRFTPAETAAWWPVRKTSLNVSRSGICSGRGCPGVATSEPSACGTRTNSPWPPSTSSPQ